jgi:hypothetical protein
MLGKRSVLAIALVATMLMSGILVFLPSEVKAASWLVTTDTDFSPGDFSVGGGYETVLVGTGVPPKRIEPESDARRLDIL